jgi:DNA excision repair protein ERCC-4
MQPANNKPPKLRSLGKLADAEPVIVVDTRDQDPLSLPRLRTQSDTLITGDYSVAGLTGLFAVERKSISDLVGCCIGRNRERFERELYRQSAYRFKRLLIVATEEDISRCRYHSSITPKTVLATLGAFEPRLDLPVVFVPCPRLAGHKIECWAFWFSREYILAANGMLRGPVLTTRSIGSLTGWEVPNGQS